ncbi:MAG: hypothetical protein HUU28_14785 [Planctomycetaceae bacterium]|nr:hypothetical protein [Planctomycetaceae bacterium]
MTDLDSALTLRDAVCSARVAAIALHAEWRWTAPAKSLPGGVDWHDVRSARAELLALCAWVAGDAGDGSRDFLYRAVLDLRIPVVRQVFGELLRLPVRWVAHDAKPLLQALWGAGFDFEPHQLADTHIAALALQLGLGHKRARPKRRDRKGEPDVRPSLFEVAQAHAQATSLETRCREFGVDLPPLARAPLAEGEPLEPERARQMARVAELVLEVWQAQFVAAARAGITSHLERIEYPFVTVNARIEWIGVHIARRDRDAVKESCRRAANAMADALRGMGFTSPGSEQEFRQFLVRQKLEGHCKRGGTFSVEDEVLREIEHLHPAIGHFRRMRRCIQIGGEPWLQVDLTGVDGRWHPEHRQLGAATGRNSCSCPNLAGISRILRPVVTAPKGRTLIELDYSQIEIGVAAAEHDDEALIEAFNSGDVYAATAKRHFHASLSEAERALSADELAKRRPDLRDRMKTMILAIIYNIQPTTIAARFGVSRSEAERERNAFLDAYPALKRGLEASVAYGNVRGRARVVSGLARFVDEGDVDRHWVANFLRNTPIQGSAAVVFKQALIELDRAFAGTSTMIVMPLHDAVLLECDQGEIEAVRARAAALMEHAFRSWYPKLRPRVHANCSAPWCWNKDGHAESLRRFFVDPAYRIGGPGVVIEEDVSDGGLGAGLDTMAAGPSEEWLDPAADPVAEMWDAHEGDRCS